MSNIEKLVIGDVLTNKEVTEVFKCGNMGGMRRSKKTNTLVIISDETKGLYKDKWVDNVLHYTGMGKIGDQVLEGNQNLTLYQSEENGIEVHLFEVKVPNQYIYMGQIKLVDTPYIEIQTDDNDVARKVWIFPVASIVNKKFDEAILEEIEEVESEYVQNRSLSGSDILILTKQRIGHGVFKKMLIQRYSKCHVCGLEQKEFLIASHIKPWSESTSNEKVDINNGLLLCPHHDALFDKGYISFTDEGKILIANELTQYTKMLMNVNETMNIGIREEMKLYIEWHRKNVYKN